MNRKARLLSFYLPQYHPIPENDQWWGKGFTEWTNVAKAKPMFRNHYQPHVPADLGFYDLRLSEARIAQAELAGKYGIEAFCYYHYWFGGKRLLERPFSDVLESSQPNFPFCLCWANQTWTGIWHGSPNRVLIEQTYPGFEDHKQHFEFLLKAFKDKRYVTVDTKPLFIIYQPQEIPELKEVCNFWRDLALQSGLPGLYLLGFKWDPSFDPRKNGLDSSVAERLPPRRPTVPKRKPIQWLFRKIQEKRGRPAIFSYSKILPDLLDGSDSLNGHYPCVIPNWDNTPRSGKNGLVLHGSTPELFRIHLRKALEIVCDYSLEQRIIFIKSWNEWAEGNHLEPDLKFGNGYLQVIKEEISDR
jgi:lipopolysaccharide biosynthesis protein